MRTRRSVSGFLAVGMISGSLALVSPTGAPAQDATSDPWAGGLADSSATPAEVPAEEDTALAIPLPEAAPTVAPSASNVLPFAKNPLPIGYPSFGMGAGAGIYRADMGKVDRAFRAIEDVYRSQGYSIASPGEIALDPVLQWNLTVRCTRSLDVALQLGRSHHRFNRLNTTGVLVTNRFLSSKDGTFSLVAGLGGGTYGFSFTRLYGVVVSPTDTNGGYSTLDRIVLEGGSRYWTGAGGVTLRPGTHTSLDLRAQYVGMGDASTDTERAGRVSLNLSGVMLGASLTFFL